MRFPIVPPTGTTFATSIAQVPPTELAVSPDGRRIAFVAAAPGQPTSVWVRSLDTLEPVRLQGTEDASYPFWSPDGQSIAFFAQSALRRADLDGGSPRTLCEVGFEPRGGTWNRDGVIVFASDTRSGLSQISATAAGARAMPLLNVREGESSYRWPSFLPDGRHFLFQIRGNGGLGIFLGSLDDPRPVPVLNDAPYNAQYARPGFLVTMRDANLLAYPFDERRFTIVGNPVRLADQVGGSTAQLASFSFALDGVLAYAGPVVTPSRLSWFDRTGHPVGASTDVGDYINFRISPEDKKVAITRVDERTNTTDIWLLDVSRNVPSRFTSDPGTDTSPVWSPDGSRIAFRSDRSGGNFPWEKPVAGNAQEHLIAAVDMAFLTDWAPDGSLVFQSSGLGTRSYDVGIVATTPGAKPAAIAPTPATEIDGRLSSDGRWIAYSSNNTGRMEVYVAPSTGLGGQQVSSAGGSEPHWRHDGRELFYLSADRWIMAVALSPGSPLEISAPQPLFATNALFPGSPYRMNYDVTSDGQRFLVSTPIEGAGMSPITVVANWATGMKR